MLYYSKQYIDDDDIKSVVEVLKSGAITQGQKLVEFEELLARKVGVHYSVAVNSATSALHLACVSLGLKKGEYLWTSSISFVASANCGLYCNAYIDFVDIQPETGLMSITALEKKLKDAAVEKKLPKIVIPVHLAGSSCDMEAIKELSKEYGFKIIEDASHAVGGRYKSKLVGSCEFSDITVFSFHPVKIITTGEGGMALTNNPELADRMQRYRSHGITSDTNKMQPRPTDEIWNYQQISLGFNYRMTDIQAALGVSQMARLDEFVKQRQHIAKRYNNELAGLALQTPWQHRDSYSSYHLYPIRLKLVENDQTQRKVYDQFHTAGILVNLHYIPVYRQPYYEAMGFKIGYCPEAEQYHKEVITFPIYPTMSEAQQDAVVSCLREALDS